MADLVYTIYKSSMLTGGVDLSGNTVKCMLVSGAYAVSATGDTSRADVTDEVTGTNYTLGGETLSTDIQNDTVDNEGVFDAVDVTWSTVTITARAAVIYKSTGTAAQDTLICYVDFGSDKSASAGDFTIQWAAEGIINVN